MEYNRQAAGRSACTGLHALWARRYGCGIIAGWGCRRYRVGVPAQRRARSARQANHRVWSWVEIQPAALRRCVAAACQCVRNALGRPSGTSKRMISTTFGIVCCRSVGSIIDPRPSHGFRIGAIIGTDACPACRGLERPGRGECPPPIGVRRGNLVSDTPAQSLWVDGRVADQARS